MDACSVDVLMRAIMFENAFLRAILLMLKVSITAQ